MNDRPVRIIRCVCHDVTFEELCRTARQTGVCSVEELQEHVEFGTDCATCLRYVRRMLQTGQTVFTEILPGDDQVES